MNSGLKSGDLVEVRSANEIFLTLESNGTLNGLPFMPEMIQYCGKSFRILGRVVQAVIDSAGIEGYNESYVRKFKDDDVVILESLRCSGVNHNGCKKSCTLFWKEAWLKRVDTVVTDYSSISFENVNSKLRLKVLTDNGKYFCQSSQFRYATNQLNYSERIKNLFTSLNTGNYSLKKLSGMLSVWFFWKIRQRLFGVYPRGSRNNTPIERLDLQEGEEVEVKSLPEIVETLDENGCNRGLHFCTDMRKYCGKRFRVKARADKLISEGTGDMREIPNTVILENAFCDSAYFAFGGCLRSDFLYWREIWLRRVQDEKSGHRKKTRAAS